MTPNPADALRQAEDYIRAGRIDIARSVLINYIKVNPNSEQAWLLLSAAVTDPKQKIDCLQRVLKINPANTRAQRELPKLLRPPTDELKPTPTPPSTPAFKTLFEAPVAPPTPGVSPTPGVTPSPAAPTPVEPALPPAPTPVKTSPPAEASLTQPVHRDPELRQPRAAGSTLATIPKAEPTFIEDEPQEEKRKFSIPRWALFAAIGAGVIVCVIGALGVYLAAQNFGLPVAFASPRPTNTPAPTATPPATATAAFPTFPPTFTPTNTPTVTLTPTITLTPTLPRPDSTVLAEMDIIQQQVADLRGLTINASVPGYVIDKKKVRETLEELYLSNGGSEERVNDQARTLSALGLIKPTYDLFTNTLNGISDGLGGFYIPWTKELYVIGVSFNGVEKYIYSHEFNHALTDQHFNFNGMGVMPVCQGDAQRCQAIRGLIEGDSTLLMNQWLLQYAGPQDYRDILNYDPPSSTLPEQFPPPYAVREGAFPYGEGYRFVKYLYDRGNWAGVDKAYESLPQSTEQILHPKKYLDGEAPIVVKDAPLGEVLGGEWRLLDQNSLGEFRTYLILGYGADVAAQLSDSVAETAAAGWGGDGYQTYYNDSAGQTVLAGHWVWDTTKDAKEFNTALLQYHDARFRGLKVDRTDGECWEANNEASCVFSIGKETLWLLAPNQTVLDLALTQFPDFLQ